MTATLAEVLRVVAGSALASGELPGPALEEVTRDSRQVRPGSLFVAIRGTTRDGLSLVPEAIERGAAAIAVERGAALALPLCRSDGTEVPVVEVDDARVALARSAHAVAGDPTRELAVVGITGTNGKTTTSYLVEAALAAAGGRVARMGTIAYVLPDEPPRPAPLTTPEGDDIARFARDARLRGATHLVMEVSSHALVLGRVEGVRFACALFTNLTQDHLDFHGTMADYEAAKRRLFVELAPRTAAIHLDDPAGRRFAAAARCEVVTFGRRATDATLRVVEASFGRDGLQARVASPAGELDVRSPLVGEHNLENVLGALAVALALGIELEDALRGIAGLHGVPGRLERVEHARGALVVVDYAHTPDALARALAALRPITPGRLLCVFGCGGDRDRQKRPLMGRAAAELADVSIVTDDNPRTERREDIHAAIVAGVESAGALRVAPSELGERGRSRVFSVVPDRAEAITLAVELASEGDTVLLAGKGHEDYQIIGTTKRPFDDRAVARGAAGPAAAGEG